MRRGAAYDTASIRNSEGILLMFIVNLNTKVNFLSTC